VNSVVFWDMTLCSVTELGALRKIPYLAFTLVILQSSEPLAKKSFRFRRRRQLFLRVRLIKLD
jgi:hypothetical protein